MTTFTVLSVQVGKVTHHDNGDRSSFESGIYKAVVEGPVRVNPLNLEGDQQADLRHHGGADRPILVYAISNVRAYEQMFGQDIPPGGFGENFTVDGPDEREACIGDVWQGNELTIQVSQPRIPCAKLGFRLGIPGIVEKTLDGRNGGYYCRVLQEGKVEAGEIFRLRVRPNPEWTVRAAFDAFLDRDHPQRFDLSEVKELSRDWRERLSGGVLN